ncbi:MAG: hypothetical protein ACRCZF_27490 [Gemmataceae bacterium]
MRMILGTVAVLVMVVTGCDSGPGKPNATPVSGVVKIDGQPAENLILEFMGTPFNARAVSGPNGKYELTTDGGAKGAAPGTYKVVVLDNNLATDEEPDGRPKSGKKLVNRVPTIYSLMNTTPITVVIEAGKSEYELLIVTK